MRTASLPAELLPGSPRSRRLLAPASDQRLVEQIRQGNDTAFEVAFERHGPSILSFCRHMLGSREEAEDVVQHTFAAAYRSLLRDERQIQLKPWLFAIARNRCLSVLRAQREPSAEEQEVPTAGLAEEVERREDLRELLRDLRDIPDEQRAALLLAEVADLSHAEIARVLGCKVPRVKALVFRARSGLIERRTARETPCDEIREQLANLRGGALRRSGLRHHLRECPGCREYREQVKQQRAMLAAALPVVPSAGLKSAVLGTLGFGGGSAGGGALVGGLGAAAAPVGASTVAKLAVVAALAGGGAVASDSLPGSEPAPRSGVPVAEQPGAVPEQEAIASPPPRAASGRGRGPDASAPAKARRRAAGRRKARNERSRREQAETKAGRKGQPDAKAKGGQRRSARAELSPRGRGAPSGAPPLRRGPAVPTPKQAPARKRSAIDAPVAPPKPAKQQKLAVDTD